MPAGYGRVVPGFDTFYSQSTLTATPQFFSAFHVLFDGKFKHKATQTAFTCSKITIETLEQGVEYFQS